MGNRSSEANGVKCNHCKCNLPSNNWNFDEILAGQKYHSFCFYVKAADEITYSYTSGTTCGQAITVTVKAGSKLYLYFRRKNKGEYYCWDCLRSIDPIYAKSVYLGLINNGHIISYNSLSTLR
ncbi:unnamed protein product [Rotaria sp. Silwood1]|nr:unnamed protein product [Rotaria sp. Silwood1]CAF1641591.1 unnamed protein product [Rotaria sp. Silwood1]